MNENKFGFWKSVGTFICDHPVMTFLTITSVVSSIAGCISQVHKDHTLAKLPSDYWAAQKALHEAAKCSVHIE